MAVKVRPDDRVFWQRRSVLGENISNGNWIVALILLLGGGFAFSRGWIGAGVGLGIAGMLSFVWNEGVAKTTYIICAWVIAGAASAWVLGFLCNAMFGMPIIGYIVGLIAGISGVIATID